GHQGEDPEEFAVARQPPAESAPAHCRRRRGGAVNAGYVTLGDPFDVASWSGVNRRIALALEAQGVELCYVGSLRDPYLIAKQVRYRIGDTLGWRRYLPDRSHLSARSYARQV